MRDGGAEATEVVGGNGAAPVGAETDDLAAMSAERDGYLEQLQRSRADFANFRRRTEQERTQIREIASHVLLTQILPVYDDLQRAMTAVPDDARDEPWVQGLALIERKFWNVLDRAGVTPIEAKDQPFDPALHEAVDSVPGSAGTTVVDVYQTGYRLGQSLLRPAMVKVGSQKSEDRSQE